MIKTENLSVGYGKRVVIDDIHFEVAPGEIVTLIGPNGSGKSTILKTIADQLTRMGGDIYVDGMELTKIPRSEIGKTMGLLLTEKVHPELLTCFDVVCSGRYPYTGRLGILSDEDKKIAEETMEFVQVTSLRDRDFSKISDGQRQRVMIARAICQDTKLLILDEPTTYLDINYKLSLMQMIKKLAKEQGKTIVMTLHELDLAKIISDRIICVTAQGKVDRVDDADAVFTEDYIDTLYGMEKGTYQNFLRSI